MFNKKCSSLCALFIATSMLFSACSSAAQETTITELTTVSGTQETIATESSETTVEEADSELVFSTAVVTERIVDNYGQLQVIGTDLCDSEGNPVRLEGMSSFGMTGMWGFINEDTVQTLAEDWGCDVIRFPMNVVNVSGDESYTSDPEKYFNQMCDYIDLCIDQGIYVMATWYNNNDDDPNNHRAEAVDFYSRLSAIYGDCPNVIYEICSEPQGYCCDDPTTEVGWENCVKPYAEEVIAAIRSNDPDNIIIVGTPHYSQDVDVASLNPIDGENIMYSVRFYAGSNGQELRDKVQMALDNGVAVFCTEWGTTREGGRGVLFYEESMEWLDFFDEKGISWCNWSIGGTFTEASNALRYVSNILTIEEKLAGHWPDEFISPSGLFVRAMILDQEFEIPEE